MNPHRPTWLRRCSLLAWDMDALNQGAYSSIIENWASESVIELSIWLEDPVGRCRTCFLRDQGNIPASTRLEPRIWEARLVRRVSGPPRLSRRNWQLPWSTHRHW